MKSKSQSKSQRKSPAKKPSVAKTSESAVFDAALASIRAATPSAADRRKELLARVAGSIAIGILREMTEDIASPTGVATSAVDIAEAILQQAGIAPSESTAEPAVTSPPLVDVSASAAA